MMKLRKKGQVGGMNIMGLVMVAGISTLLLILVSVLAGTSYSITEPQITAITNATIESYVRNSASSGFTSLTTVGQYMPLIILGIVMFIVLSFVYSIGRATGGGGSAL